MDRIRVVFLLKFFTILILFIFSCLLLTMCGNKLFYFYNYNENTETLSHSDIYKTIIIDAGHGGEDGGAVSFDGTILEKDINLDIALKLFDLLRMTGFDVVLTRSNDVLLASEKVTSSKKRSDLMRRVEIANEYDKPLFISIHQNKFEIEKYNGLQVYYSHNSNESKSIAEAIQKDVKHFLQSNNNRKVKQAGSSIFVLDRIECPAVLVECGFLSNKEELNLLADDLYRRKLSFVLYTAIVNYLYTQPNA